VTAAKKPLDCSADIWELRTLGTMMRASTAAHVLGEETLAKALLEFQPDATIECHFDAAEIAMACRLVDEKCAEALRFRPWARVALSQAAELLEGSGYACDLACALALVARPVSPLAVEVHAHAAHA